MNIYEATTHFNGQSTIELDGMLARGVHVKNENGKRSLMIASIRYLDTFTKQDAAWYFAERILMVDWVETRPLSQTTV